MLHADRRSLLTLGALTALALIAAAALALRGEETSDGQNWISVSLWDSMLYSLHAAP